MAQRFLPIYYTGWFYLLLTFWTFSVIYINDGGLNKLSQIHFNGLYEYFNPNLKTANQNSRLPNTLILESNLDEKDKNELQLLLTMHPHSKIVLLGELSSEYLSALSLYLDNQPRKNKIIINSKHLSSGQPINTISGILPNISSHFRYPSRDLTKRIETKHYIFTPNLIIKPQKTTLLWQHQQHIYLSLLGELVQQLTMAEMVLTENWQLSLSKELPPNSLFSPKNGISTTYSNDTSDNQLKRVSSNLNATRSIKIGFSSQLFTATNEPLNTNIQHLMSMPVNTMSQYMALFNKHGKESVIAYDLIIISNKKQNDSQMLVSMLNQVVVNKSLSQNITTLLLLASFSIVGLVLIWFITAFSYKKQAFIVLVYYFVLLTAQYVLFNQQQWLNILPLILILTGSWVIHLGYQREKQFMLTLVNKNCLIAQEVENSHSGPTSIKQYENSIFTDNKQDNPQSIVNSTIKTMSLSQTLEKTSDGPLAITLDDLQKTMVIQNNESTINSLNQHHFTCNNFGRYQVEGILGKGAMGIVYQGVDPKINRHVAIKTLRLNDDDESSDNHAAKSRFFKEAQTAGGLSHANIVTIYDVGEENNLGYIAMDLLTGAPLSLFTQPTKTLPVPLVYQLLVQICDALDYAHNQNVVHRDIKPDNIIYDDDLLKVTVTDFGIAYVNDNSKTRTGIIMGSPYYMSPEQILGLKIDGRSDIFSLGVTFYQLLCGHLPFEGESIATVAYQITKVKAIAVNEHDSRLPSSAQRICNKAMHKDSTKRYQSMAEFKSALISALKRDFKVSV